MKATLDDIAEIIRLEQECFSEPWSERILRDGLCDLKYLFLLLRDDGGNAIGYLIGWVVAGEVELARVGITPEARGRGLSRRLLDEALQTWRSSGAEIVFLEVRASNEPARRLYVSRGFEVISKRAKYYDDGEDALILSLHL